MTPDEITAAIADAPSWNARVSMVRRIPEDFGIAQHQAIYARVAELAYVPHLKPDFGYVHWRPEYEMGPFVEAYADAEAGTARFSRVDQAHLASVIRATPHALRVFRLMLGFTASEFAACAALLPESRALSPLTKSRVDSIESGRRPTDAEAASSAAVIDLGMDGSLFPAEPGAVLRPKTDKPDTSRGWETVRTLAVEGVPLSMLLHQRAYGGAFRQLLDATSSMRGDLLEEPVAELFYGAGIPFIRTGSHNQGEIEERFKVTVRPAPDFVVYDNRTDTLKAFLEMKGANDGGTARDKAARFRSLRAEAQRLGGVAVFAVLAGTGWRRTQDALGPVVRDTDGRVFTAATIGEMLEVEPFPSLAGLADLHTWPSEPDAG